jgi:cyanate permease
MTHIRNRWARFAVAGMLALGLASSAGVALAATGPAFTGACNMLASWDVGVNGTAGMTNAMTLFGGHDNANGDTGMWLAVEQSGNLPFTCNPA